jgi:hypothetical protein
MPKTSTTASAVTAAPRAKRARRATALVRRRRRTATPVSHEQIAVRAYEIHLSDAAGDPLDHWLTAERELAGG